MHSKQIRSESYEYWILKDSERVDFIPFHFMYKSTNR